MNPIMLMVKCPKCDKVLTQLGGSPAVTEMTIQSQSFIYEALAIACPSCLSVLSITANPHALAEEIVKKLKTGK